MVFPCYVSGEAGRVKHRGEGGGVGGAGEIVGVPEHACGERSEARE